MSIYKPQFSKLCIHAVSFISIIIAACWLGDQKNLEPLLALIGLLVPYCLSLHVLFKDMFCKGQQAITKLFSSETGFESIRPSVNSALSLLSGISQSDTYGEVEKALQGHYQLLFRSLGLLKTDSSGQLHPVSNRADLFLKSLALSALNSHEFAGNWCAEGTQNSEAKLLGDLLENIEQYRIKMSGGIDNTTPVRTVKCSIVLLKAKKENEDVFLMRWSDAWGGYFWFIGGIQEKDDADATECGKRELREEIQIDDRAIESIALFTEVQDKRISKRLRVLGQYNFSLFTCTLRKSHNSVQKLLASNFIINKQLHWAIVEQECKWLKWSEIRACPNLTTDAGFILEAIEAYGLERIPLCFVNTITP